MVVVGARTISNGMNSPWDIKKEDFPEAGSLDEQIRFILGYAILAPSTHNIQPWLFKVEVGFCKIYYNKELKLPEADPLGRDLYISMGCMIENLVIAAKYFGLFGDIKIEPKDDYIGEVFFKSYGDINHELGFLMDAMPRRINARGVFENWAVPEETKARLLSLNKNANIKVNIVTDKGKINDLSSLTAEGLKLAYRKKKFRKEMFRWMRSNLTRKKDGLPGYSLRMPFFLSFIIPTLVKFVNIGSSLARLNYKSMASVPFICILSSEHSNPKTWLEIGRLAERYMLQLNSEGIRTSIFVASIEMGDLYEKVIEVVGDISTPQFLFCAGYMQNVQKHSPRHTVRDKLI